MRKVVFMSIYLSKSKYCSAVQCPKMLWLKENKPDEFDSSVMNDAILEKGNEVGDLAMGLFGDFTEVPYGNRTEMINLTKKLIDDNVPVITEASFSYDGLFCSVDILKNLGNNQVEMYEVKSSTSIHDIYLDDVSYQCYVLKNLGFDVKKASLVHINRNYVRKGELDLEKLFVINDITDIAFSKQDEIADNISYLENYMSQTNEPDDDIGEHCFSPYDCGFFSYCTKHLPRPNVFDVAGANRSKKFDCYRKGIISFDDLLTCDVFSGHQYKQIEHEVYGQPPFIDEKDIREFMKCLSYPIYFLDFESFQPVIPLFENSRPYDQIVFQYSLHYIETEDGELHHKEFLAYPGCDPRRKLAERLCEDIPKDVCVTAYNMGFEKMCIKGLSELYPDLAEHLMNIHENIKDLMIPFRRKMYYDKAMEGSYSIKYVLPALFPDDPALDYHNLEGVHNGSEASATFSEMAKMDKKTLEEYRGYLLKYCGLDTYAMVKIWEKLKEI